jgi:tetratricopeptide (TPR) repeat protein
LILVVAPFAAPGVDPDALDVARFAAAEAAFALDVPGASATALEDAAKALGADAALSGTVQLVRGELVIDAILAGAVRAEFSEVLPLGALPQLGRMLARATLLALGEDAAAPPLVVEAEIAPDQALRLASAFRQLEEGAPDDLLELAAGDPPLFAARRLLLSWASAGLGTPEPHAALERFCEAQPEDAEAVLLLAESRAMLLDEEGARELYLQARAEAADDESEARALRGLATLAEKAGRDDEAIAHLRAAVKLVDDPALHARLANLLLPRDPQEGIASLTRATVLAPEDAGLWLQLATALRPLDPQRALNAAAEAARLAEDDEELSARVRAELEAILAEND